MHQLVNHHPIPAEHDPETSPGGSRSRLNGPDQMPLPGLVRSDSGIALGCHAIAMPLKFGRSQNAIIKSLSQTMPSYVQPVSIMAGDVSAVRVATPHNFRQKFRDKI